MSAIDPGRFSPPPGFSRTAEKLEAAGFQAWAVGGAIRDAYVSQIGSTPGVEPGWEDLTTNARPDDVMRLFRRTVPVGVSHGTVKVLDGDDGYEVTTFRRDVETDGRHARVAFADSIEEDLSRRDFTANAIAWRPASGEVRDEWGGAEDIEDGILRAVGEPEARFREDYLRILRGFRFAGRFEWAVEARTDEAMREAVDGLAGLSAERVREELLKVMADPKPSAALDLYADCGALGHWYPELLGLAADGDAWKSALGAVDAAPAQAANVRLASLLVCTSETPEGRAEAAESLLSRLKFSNADRRYLARLAGCTCPSSGRWTPRRSTGAGSRRSATRGRTCSSCTSPPPAPRASRERSATWRRPASASAKSARGNRRSTWRVSRSRETTSSRSACRRARSCGCCWRSCSNRSSRTPAETSARPCSKRPAG